MSQPPLTHHEILQLVEPFSRRGRAVDLAASQRAERRLVFKPAAAPHGEAAAVASDALPWTERLQLDNPSAGTYRLTRSLRLACGLEASMVTQGASPAELLARIEATDPALGVRSGPGWRIALHHRLEAGAAGAPVGMVLTHARAQAGGLMLHMRVPAARGPAAELDLSADTAAPAELPEDLFAVLGWSWARLRRTTPGWTTRLKLPAREPARRSAAEARLLRSVQHLAQVLAAPPTQFHPQWQAARWRVVLRRAIPLLTFLTIAGVVMAMPSLGLDQTSRVPWAFFNLPLALMALSLSLQEMSRIEIPPLPRPLPGAAWQASAPEAAAPGSAAE
jgi:hypothetical protein